MNLKGFFKVALLSSLLSSVVPTSLFAGYENLKIGKIDPYYKDKLSKQELENIIRNIEQNFKDTLGFEVFGLSANGKPIDIIYMPPSKTKLSIDKLIKKLKIKYSNILNKMETLQSKRKSFEIMENKIKSFNEEINKKIKQLNEFIEKANNTTLSSKAEYEKIKKHINKQKKDISFDQHKLDMMSIKYKDQIDAFNQRQSLYNVEVREFNRMQRKTEVLARSIKEVKGVAMGFKEITINETIENGKLVRKKSQRNYMEKIEIYGFESLDELEVVLAHEIAHMVGVGHVDAKDALMNPILQQSQIGNLSLTSHDIDAFNKAFE